MRKRVKDNIKPKEIQISASMNPTSRKQTKAIISILEQEFLDGEKYSIQQLLVRFFNLKTVVNALVAERKVRGWIHTLKDSMYRKHGVMFGCVNNLGQYGLAQNEAEYRYIGTTRYTFTKGILDRTQKYMKEAVSNGFLRGSIEEEKVLLPHLKNGK